MWKVSTQQRRERERAQRHDLIVKTARKLAESEGWDAVTTRRLADEIEYSQPVLYSHFAGKDAIVAAVALEGFTELAVRLRAATRTGEPRAALEELARAYMAFAEENPALYDAMFTMAVDLPFGQDDTPEPLRDGFQALLSGVAQFAGGRDPGILTEVAWSALHGLIVLSRGGRLPASGREARLALLLDQLSATR
ncbi:TetR family transcriptional regulator [Planobispora rosea]|uniref:TetR family transcriptional regulator n=1 Tax=Planobispora rosea TaxID=35762 RepID=A0A8J3WGC5_PLARO|nr:TetR/AcrR family transcriptional regulator [Planobispora rosea]GGT07697.1 TetR family transcriptional regulator [Planobispora rosea]GIH89164.1 TetR family transcriptional regulator [Planobispora rosea]